MAYKYETIKCEVNNKIALVTLNLPKYNILNGQMLRDIRDVMNELKQEADLRCAIFTGEGDRAFCAGADVGEFTDPTIDDLEEVDVWARGILTKLANFPIPTIAAINGYALGGGLELALACDIRVASETAKMGLVETSLGMIAGWGGSQRMVRTIGAGQAKKMMFTADKISAEKALQIGLVQEVYKAEELIDRTMEMAQKIAANSPVANRLTKQGVNCYLNQGINDGLDLERMLDRAAYESEDSKEGMKAFEEKRTPDFKNK
ncbi:enoyl-CoA hydratase [Desulfuromusa kysingii]|uniref:Enoyl-CoA hydratase n=1 Tax=Desulfuromusa kysingii TaxID=37625 RepID=A0A1H4C6I0_9BACT|nr:enoyl-CoA hydratase-related protein [Desulfuromusa kysingii]SEA56011.1 enoyl-CoA hydratase [Desulfuromusa kysingii]